MDVLHQGSSGPLVELLQSTLNRLGYDTNGIDGRFGDRTRTAVTAFQRSLGLQADGIVGPNTWLALRPTIDGHFKHTIRAGDTMYTLAARYGTTVARIAAANPTLNAAALPLGATIVIPAGSIVPTDISYSSSVLALNLAALQAVYPFLRMESIGSSVMGRELTCVAIGNGARQVFYNASFHANEWITTPVLMKFLEQYALAYVENSTVLGFTARYLFNHVTLYIVPMVNPDGVDLVTGALPLSSSAYQQAARIGQSFPAIPFPSGWKANIDGVDLNLQFPANWESARDIKFAQGFTQPAPRDYVGAAPLTAPEARAVYEFTRAHNFTLALAYHTQGKVIFWQYLDYLPEGSYFIARQFALISGYALEQTPYASSFAGYKDWFIQEYNRPAYTIEAGLGVNPLPISQFDEIYADNAGILTLGIVLVP